MSLFGALNSATAGLRQVQAGVKVVSDNIARADDPDRTRHSLHQTVDRSGQVFTTDYRREVDNGLKQQLEGLIARDGNFQTRNSYMEKLGDLLRTTNGKPLLATYASDFEAAWRTLETSPESEVAGYQLVQAADTYAREIRRVSQGVEDLDREMRLDIENSVDETNELLRQINQINTDIVSLRTQGSAANEVADKRDALLRQLNEYVGVKTVTRPDGRIAVFTDSGLALVDSDTAKLSFDGGKITVQTGNNVQDITDHLRQGKIGALFAMRYDGSTTEPPTKASADPSAEVIRKLRSQLDALAGAFVSPTKAGEPTSFADAYNNADPVQDGELGSKFFMGSDRFTLQVNPDLVNDVKKIKVSAIDDMVIAFNSVGRSLSADGLSLTDTSYTGMATAITGNWTAVAKSVKDSADLEEGTKNLLEERYHGNIGVNMDQEIALLQQLQTSYAASARVMQVTNSMFDALESIVR